MSSTWDAWTYRASAARTPQSADIVGYEAHATDGHIGKVDEASNDVGASQLVVDTGPWIFGRKVRCRRARSTASMTPRRRCMWT